ncbi:hypothetical protein IMG5_075500 [Ichthyophthirius multifiliis]|uniref:Uncharacterized protein n=1 Tax=Ichthyophthirius multifiliis TaxID=5932 RepID=G0QQ53_ICHMU|nr:hypothetical protein IMG5_075500 [Ichthyophthirius multifiliis]EGR32649.1 hypothetical protein IMG5_075500 [Ichthyophthirius multifiliis]|eukprot:XP_004036635.1 hypothetical protein IMG5_075500 [Ichthyophthirius multifiliis]
MDKLINTIKNNSTLITISAALSTAAIMLYLNIKSDEEVKHQPKQSPKKSPYKAKHSQNILDKALLDKITAEIQSKNLDFDSFEFIEVIQEQSRILIKDQFIKLTTENREKRRFELKNNQYNKYFDIVSLYNEQIDLLLEEAQQDLILKLKKNRLLEK